MFDQHGVRLYLGDVRDLYASLALTPSVLLTDPPYAAYKYLRLTEETRQVSVAADERWSGSVFEWVGEWFWQVRMSMTPDGVAWLFCNVHYLGFYVRWAKYAGWPLRGLFACPPDEFLLALGSEPLSARVGERLQRACQGNTYGQNKPLELLTALLGASPAGLVLDPFAGLGSTLDAARQLQRPAVGIEIDDTLVQRTIERWNHSNASRSATSTP